MYEICFKELTFYAKIDMGPPPQWQVKKELQFWGIISYTYNMYVPKNINFILFIKVDYFTKYVGLCFSHKKQTC